MSERMKQGERRQGMTPAALWQHQRRGREALQLEIAGEYDAAASPAHDGVDKQPDGMDMQVKAPGNVDGGHGPFLPVNPQHNLVFQLFFFFRGQWSGTDG